MEDVLHRFVDDFFGRAHGPLTFRLVSQPLIALLLAVRDGVHDARGRKPAYLWALLSDPRHRRERIREGWKSIGKLFGIAFGLDCIYQLFVWRWIYPDEALVMSLLLAVVPYLMIRGPINRLIHGHA
jgi:hypothetical protein